MVGTYRTQEEVDAWAKRDPIDTFRRRLVEEFGVADADELDGDRGARSRRSSSEALDFARNSPEPDPATVRRHVFAEPINPPEALRHAAPAARPRTHGLARRGARRHRRGDAARTRHILYFGEGTGERGGTFAHTKGLWQEFGAAADGRHADLRAGLHRRRGRRLGDRRAHASPT